MEQTGIVDEFRELHVRVLIPGLAALDRLIFGGQDRASNPGGTRTATDSSHSAGGEGRKNLLVL